MDIFASSLPALTSAQPPGAPSLPEPMMYLGEFYAGSSVKEMCIQCDVALSAVLKPILLEHCTLQKISVTQRYVKDLYTVLKDRKVLYTTLLNYWW